MAGTKNRWKEINAWTTIRDNTITLESFILIYHTCSGHVILLTWCYKTSVVYPIVIMDPLCYVCVFVCCDFILYNSDWLIITKDIKCCEYQIRLICLGWWFCCYKTDINYCGHILKSSPVSSWFNKWCGLFTITFCIWLIYVIG